MWLFAPDMFISAVASDTADTLVVRARDQGSLNAFNRRLDQCRERDDVAYPRSSAIANGGTDYEWREYVQVDGVVAVAALVAFEAREYDNFKNAAVRARPARAWRTFLTDVWMAGVDFARDMTR